MTPGETNADGTLHTTQPVSDIGQFLMRILVGYEGYLTNTTINGRISQQQSGATILLEHRFYGDSNPLPDLSVKSLRLLTIQQAIDDFEYFANHVTLPMPGGNQLTPDKVPWILVGGSYSGTAIHSPSIGSDTHTIQGALTSWTMVK